MTHSAAQTYCAGEKMVDIDFVDMDSLQAIPAVMTVLGRRP